MWIIAGLVLGALAGLDSGLEALIGGAVIGAIVGALIQFFTRKPKVDATALAQLEARVALLEQTVAQLRAGGAERVPTPAPVTSPPPVADAVEPSLPVFETDALPPAEPVRRRGADVLAARRGEPAPARCAPVERTPGTLDQLYDTARAWLLGGNTVVRVGLLVLFFGLAFLARYAVENSMLPVEFRLAGIAFGGIALLVVGWRLRKQRSGYALSLQGGGVGVLYLTIFAAMRMVQMIPPTLGFALLLAVVVFAAALAVLQNAQALAVIGIAGGFMAPIIASTGQGSHVMLFGYYLLLNAGLLAMAWKKAWRVLNLVGFVFTFSIALAWGAKDYNPALFASTEPFLIAFVLMYVAAAVLYAWRSAPSLKDYVDGTLVFGTPVVGFGLQAALVQDMPYGLAWSALALGGFYVVLARWLHGRARPSLRLLVESFLALGVAFLTLTIPLAVDGQWTAAAWAMEGAALLWVGTRQSRKLAMASGLVLQLAAGAFFVADGGLEAYGRVWPLFNSQCFGAALIALAGFFSSRFADTARDHWPRLLSVAAPALLVWATLWWLAGGMTELDAWFNNRQLAAAALGFFAASGALASLAAVRFNWPALHGPALLAIPGMVLSLLLTLLHASTHPLADWGLLAWPLAVASALFALRRAEGTPVVAKVLRHGHTAWLWLASFALAWAAGDVIDGAVAGDSWSHAAVLAVVALVMVGVQHLALRGAWPAGPWRQAYLGLGNTGLAAAGLGWALLVSVAGGGDVTPLPYLPLLNPLDLAMGLMLLVVFRGWQGQGQGEAMPALPALRGTGLKVLAAVGFVLANGALLRAVHHLAGVPWSEAALFESDTVQASVSLFWGLLGLALTFIASRRQRRTLWMLGAVLLGVVVAKLFLVDMASTGTVARIVSFLGAGVVLLVVGYFSPLPPVREQKRMKILPWFLMAMAPLALAAPAAEDFDVRLAIEAPADASLLQLNLPADVYRAVRHADLRDVRIFNAAGEAVPMARLPRQTETQALRVERPLVALPARAAAVRDGVSVHASGAASVRVEVDGASPVTTTALPGYLLEVKDFDATIDELTLVWPEATPFEAAVSVQASDDLQQWRSVAHRTALLSLGEGEARIVQDRVALPAVRARYLRIDWVGTPPPVSLQRAVLLNQRRSATVAREWVELTGQADAKNIDFTSPGLFPVEALRLVPVSDSDVISASVASRPAVSGRWRWRARTVGYRLQQAGGLDEGEATAIAVTRDPLWRVTLDAEASTTPRLALGWTPESVAFVARGAGPYTLAVGHASAASAWQAPGQVVPGFGTDQAATLVSARVLLGEAPVAAAPREPAPWQAGSHWWLWGALLLGVGVLGAMARGLWREMAGAKDSPPE